MNFYHMDFQAFKPLIPNRAVFEAIGLSYFLKKSFLFQNVNCGKDG